MERLTAAQRKRLPKSDFAVPSKAPGPGSYPMPDKKHAAVAKGRATQFGSAKVKAAVAAKAAKKFPAMGRESGGQFGNSRTTRTGSMRRQRRGY